MAIFPDPIQAPHSGIGTLWEIFADYGFIETVGRNLERLIIK